MRNIYISVQNLPNRVKREPYQYEIYNLTENYESGNLNDDEPDDDLGESDARVEKVTLEESERTNLLDDEGRKEELGDEDEDEEARGSGSSSLRGRSERPKPDKLGTKPPEVNGREES